MKSTLLSYQPGFVARFKSLIVCPLSWQTIEFLAEAVRYLFVAEKCRQLRGINMFCEERVAQIAAYLLSKDGGRMAYLKLMKLMYLSDREAMNRFGEPLSGDRMVAMPHGPVLSRSLDLMNGNVSGENGWDRWISDAENYELRLRPPAPSREDFDELSDADISVLEAVYNAFGHMTKWQIRDYTHQHCAEWCDPQGGSFTINPENVFRALGKPEHLVRILADRMRELSDLDRITDGLK